MILGAGYGLRLEPAEDEIIHFLASAWNSDRELFSNSCGQTAREHNFERAHGVVLLLYRHDKWRVVDSRPMFVDCKVRAESYTWSYNQTFFP